MSTTEVGHDAKPFLLVLGVTVVALALYFATGMPGMDHSAGSLGGMDGMAGHRLVDPTEFHEMLGDTGVVAINVHVPADEITLPGTDLEVPFDALDGAVLPDKLDTTLAVYCRSGNMSAIAVKTLLTMGYTDVVELRGGTEAARATNPSVGHP